MSALRSLTLELSEEQIGQIEAHVASGAYASVSEVVAAAVAELPDRDMHTDEGSPDWSAFVERVRETCRRMDAGTEPLIPIDDVRTRIAVRRALEDQQRRDQG